MADKIIQLRIDVTKINKEWLYKGEKGTYLDMTLFFNEKQDQYETNGMITQQVPKKVWEAEKDKPKDQQIKGAILGNAKVFGSEKRETTPGTEIAGAGPAVAEDLPF